MAKQAQQQQDSSFLDIDLANVPELIVLPEGEYKVRVAHAELKQSQKGNRYLNFRMEVPSEPTSEDIYHMIMLPTPEDSDKQKIKRRTELRDFCLAFGVDPSATPLQIGNFVGGESWALLGEEDDPTYGKRNIVKTIIGG